MNYKKLGNTDLNVSTICLGTMTWGEQNTEAEGFEQMNYALEQGVNFWDTAELYAIPPKEKTYGKTEEVIGNWFKKSKKRSEVILATKVAGPGLNWIRGGGNQYDEKNLNKAVDGSLKRLKTDYIDLYQLHWPERKVPMFGQLDFKYDPSDNEWTSVEEVLENLNSIIKAGKIRYIGLSNETPWGVMKFLETSKDKNLPRVMSIQNVYSLVNRVFDIHNSEVSIREKCGLLAYSPLAGGRLSGKYIGNKNPKNARYTLWPSRFSRHHTKRGEIAIKAYVDLAKKYKLAPSTFANAFVNNRPFVTSNIIGATSMKQLKENIDSINVNLPKEILEEIQKIHLLDPNPCV